MKPINISIAPLMGYTDINFCLLMKLIAPRFSLYTEMLHANALVKGMAHRSYAPMAEHLALQLGGSEPDQLANAAVIAQDFGFQEINLNVGCPSPRVQKGAFGACLMKEPGLVAACVASMKQAVDLPITVKCRIGVDDHDGDDFLYDFIQNLMDSNCDKVVVHARKALLKGLSPAQNRSVPPINYEKVYQIKRKFSAMPIIINGEVKTYSQIVEHHKHVDGVMLGRWAIEQPWSLRQIHTTCFPNDVLLPRHEVLRQYLSSVKHARGSIVSQIRPLHRLVHNEPGAKDWRRLLSDIKTWHDGVCVTLLDSISDMC
jgi:tRNA-dihydrouridine synthase A